MKFQSSELPIGKPQTRRKTSKLAPLIALTILLTIPLYYPTIRDSSKKLYDTSPVYDDAPLDEPIKPILDDDPIKPTSHLETLTPLKENTEENSLNYSSVEYDNGTNGGVEFDNGTNGSVEFDNGTNGGDVAGAHHEPPPVRKKHEKGRRKRTPHHTAHKEVNKKHTTISNKEVYSGQEEKTESIRSRLLDDDQCDLFTGEWVPNPEGPYYTNDTCNAIQEHQNCLKFGRPDRGFLKWRWKPDDCDLEVFDPARFLELVRGKSLAFVGDSVARNHMQSLICLLSRVANPEDLSGPLDQNKRYEYHDHDFNISMFWAPYLVKTQKTDANDEKRPFQLYLDEFDQHWTNQIASFDYVIISAGHWFFRPTYFHLNGRLTGCLYCPEPDVPHLPSSFSYRRAFRTALRAVADFDGVVFLRTFAPSHFEGAAWDKGGDCARTRPYARNDVVLEDYSLEMYVIQLEELRIAQRAGRRSGGKFRLFDATRAMLLRPDGHPSKYGHLQGTNQTFANDCVHWCLPGPIDAWNDFLQELLRREIGDRSR